MNGVGDILYPIAAATAWIGLLNRVPSLRRNARDPILLALCAAFFGLGLTFTIVTPTIFIGVDGLLGLPNVSAFISQCSVLVYTASLEALLLFWVYPLRVARPRVWRRLGVYAAIIPLMATLFVLADTDEQRVRDFVAHYAGSPAITLYLVLYLSAFAFGQTDMARLSVRYAVVCGRPWLRRGLLAMATGGALGVVYSVARAADLIAVRMGVDPHRWEVIPQLSAALGAILVVVGLTLPSWSGSLLTTYTWLQRLRLYLDLHPLWSALHRALPEVELDLPGSRHLDLATLDGLDLLLYRRMIEILDARLLLLPNYDPNVTAAARNAGQAAGLAGEDLDAVVEAAQIGAALSAHRGSSPGGAAPESLASDNDLDDSDLQEQAEWLAKVSRAYHASPVVHATVHHLQPSPTSETVHDAQGNS